MWDYSRGVMGKMATAGLGYKEGYCVSSDGSTAGQRPKLEVDWQIEDTQTSYYYLGSQRVALRVEEGDEDDVYWLHTDHLGSTSLLSTITGTQVSGSTARFLPFGDYRTEPESDLTDKGLTGHVQNDPLGLVFMRARFYVSSVGRFIQPDTIIPQPLNPQAFNRYSYVNNNPLKYHDPSGHALECGLLGEDCGGESSPSSPAVPPPPLLAPTIGPQEIPAPNAGTDTISTGTGGPFLGVPSCPLGQNWVVLRYGREGYAYLLLEEGSSYLHHGQIIGPGGEVIESYVEASQDAKIPIGPVSVGVEFSCFSADGCGVDPVIGLDPGGMVGIPVNTVGVELTPQELKAYYFEAGAVGVTWEFPESVLILTHPSVIAAAGGTIEFGDQYVSAYPIFRGYVVYCTDPQSWSIWAGARDLAFRVQPN